MARAKKCAGVKVSGYWKGYSCGTPAEVKVGRKMYCPLHAHIARTDPDRFKKTIEAAKRTALKRNAAALKAAQEEDRRRAADAKILVAYHGDIDGDLEGYDGP